MRFNFEQTNRVLKLKVSSLNVMNLDLEGVRYNGADLTFDRHLWSKPHAEIAACAYLNSGYSFSLRSAISHDPDKEDLKKINARINASLKMEDVYIFRRAILNTSTSINLGVRILPSALQKFRADCAGLSRNMNHDENHVVGKVFEGNIYEGNLNGVGGQHLISSEYIMRRADDGSAMNTKLISNVRGGVYDKDSVTIWPRKGLRVKREEQGGAERQIIEFFFDPSMQDFEEPGLQEVSFVYKGEVSGAGAVTPLSSTDGNNDNPVVSLAGLNHIKDLNPQGNNDKPAASHAPKPSINNNTMTPFYLTVGKNRLQFKLNDGENTDSVANQINGAIESAVNLAVQEQAEKTKEAETKLAAALESEKAIKDLFVSGLVARAGAVAALKSNDKFDANTVHNTYMEMPVNMLKLEAERIGSDMDYLSKLKAEAPADSPASFASDID